MYIQNKADKHNNTKTEERSSMEENVIEFIKNSNRMTLSLSQGKWITKVKKLKEKYPTEVDIIENKDGTILAHMPVSYLHLSNSKRELTEAQRNELAKRLAKNRKN